MATNESVSARLKHIERETHRMVRAKEPVPQIVGELSAFVVELAKIVGEHVNADARTEHVIEEGRMR